MGNDIYYESQCRATALKCLFWVKLRDISLGARIMQGAQGKQLRGWCLLASGSKGVPRKQGNAVIRLVPIHPVLLSP